MFGHVRTLQGLCTFVDVEPHTTLQMQGVRKSIFPRTMPRHCYKRLYRTRLCRLLYNRLAFPKKKKRKDRTIRDGYVRLARIIIKSEHYKEMVHPNRVHFEVATHVPR